jgi:hypothetical protein
MALSKGERMALYLLLSSESRFAGKINGTLTANGDVPSPGNPPTGPAGSPQAALARLQTGAGPGAGNLGIDPGSLTDTGLADMFTPNGLVSNDAHVLRNSLAMDNYGDSGPCPSGGDEGALVRGLQATIDGDQGNP